MSGISPQNALTISSFISSYKNLDEAEKKFFSPKIKELFNAKIQFKSTKTLDMIALEVIKELLDTPPLLKFPCTSKFIESDLFQCCKLLKENQLFTDENALAILSHPTPKLLFAALCTLQTHELLTSAEKQEYFTAVTKHLTAPHQAANALAILNKAGLLNAENMAVTTHPVNPAATAKFLTLIFQLGLLSGEHAENNFEKVINHRRPASVLLDIELLDPADEKLQDKFERIMRPHSYTPTPLLLKVLAGDIAAIEINIPFSPTQPPKGVVASMIPGAY
ncbi:MAG: hypothetical protein P4L79_06690 [Legionella sp.]|uniref:hypothetical protein n=1 Tax=Legionella sp. TaxID=459 RepID=UPI00285022C0|nr:hypothetical protein [Legionella sp.]